MIRIGPSCALCPEDTVYDFPDRTGGLLTVRNGHAQTTAAASSARRKACALLPETDGRWDHAKCFQYLRRINLRRDCLLILKKELLRNWIVTAEYRISRLIDRIDAPGLGSLGPVARPN